MKKIERMLRAQHDALEKVEAARQMLPDVHIGKKVVGRATFSGGQPRIVIASPLTIAEANALHVWLGEMLTEE